MEFDRFTEKSRGFLQAAQTLAMRNDHQSLEPEHLLKVMLEDEDGHTAVALFTSPERAKPVVDHFPAYKGGFLADTIWVLERFGDRGIVLNPGWPVGLELDAGSVKAILRLNLAQRIPGQ